MNIITLTSENIEREHICCAISNNNDCQVAAKKAWLREHFNDGLTFKKGDVRGKCFIEYIPAKNAWVPVLADDCMYIDCLWVSGQFKGHGFSNELLNACIEDSKQRGFLGLVTLSSKKKMGFLADRKYLCYKGFVTADTAAPYFELMYLPFDNAQNAPLPKFSENVGKFRTCEEGFSLYYSHQCPFTAKYVPMLVVAAQERGVKISVTRFETTQQAKNAPSPFTAFSLFYNGEFVTHEILSVPKFNKLMDEKLLLQ